MPDNLQELYQSLLEAIGEAIFVHDPVTWAILDVNNSTCELFGYSREELLGLQIGDLSSGQPPYDGPAAIGYLERARSGRPQVFEWQARNRQGQLFWVENRMRRALIQGRERLVVTTRSIHDRKQAEQDRQLNERRLNALLRLHEMKEATLNQLADYALEEAIALTRSQLGYLAFLNDDETVMTMYSWSREAMATCGIEDKPRTYPVVTTGLWGEAVRQRRPVITNEYAADNPLKKGIPEGHVPIRRHMNVPVCDGARIVLVAGVGNKSEPYDDVDVRQLALMMQGLWTLHQRRCADEEYQRLTQQMQKAQKLESLGVLAGGIAHDFNNLLTVVLGNAELVLQDLPETDAARTGVLEIAKAARTASALSRQMLAYSGRGSFVVEKVDVRELIRELQPLLDASHAKNTLLELELGPEPILVPIDRSQMRQVILNVVTNAAEAMGDRPGRIRVRTEARALSREFLSVTFLDDHLPDGKYAVIEVIDDGPGMDKAVQARIFEPFFSTKFVGRGLGLPMVLGIIRGHKGALQIHSEPGQGTCVCLLLPMVREDALAAAREAAADAVPATAGGTVLLVEDEAAVRTLGARMLERLGYRVLAAADGEEAVRIYRERAQEIRAVILDLTMPRMNGEETLQALLGMNPQVKVVLASGYNGADMLARYAQKGLVGFIQKPYRVQDLRDALQAALHPHAGP